MIPSNREIALTKALEYFRIYNGDVGQSLIEVAGDLLKFLDGPGPEDAITEYQRLAGIAGATGTGAS